MEMDSHFCVTAAAAGLHQACACVRACALGLRALRQALDRSTAPARGSVRLWISSTWLVQAPVVSVKVSLAHVFRLSLAYVLCLLFVPTSLGCVSSASLSPKLLAHSTRLP